MNSNTSAIFLLNEQQNPSIDYHAQRKKKKEKQTSKNINSYNKSVRFALFFSFFNPCLLFFFSLSFPSLLNPPINHPTTTPKEDNNNKPKHNLPISPFSHKPRPPPPPEIYKHIPSPTADFKTQLRALTPRGKDRTIGAVLAKYLREDCTILPSCQAHPPRNQWNSLVSKMRKIIGWQQRLYPLSPSISDACLRTFRRLFAPLLY